METKEIVAIIEALDGAQLNDVILAVRKTFDRINPEQELAWVALPKYDPEKRKQVVRLFNEMAEETARESE